jgi:hypothetical protein
MSFISKIKKRFSNMKKRMFFRFAKKAFTTDLTMSEVYLEKLKDSQLKNAEGIKELSDLSATQFKDLSLHLTEKHKEITQEFKTQSEEFSKKRIKILTTLENTLEDTQKMQSKAKQIVEASASILFELRAKAIERKELLMEIHRRADMLFSDIKRLDNMDSRIEKITEDLRELESDTTDIGSKILSITHNNNVRYNQLQ